MMSMIETALRQRIDAPSSDDYVRPPALLSVEVADDEDVEWIWTHYADGRSAVTGYRIVPSRALLALPEETSR